MQEKPSFEEKTRFLLVFCTFFLYEPKGETKELFVHRFIFFRLKMCVKCDLKVNGTLPSFSSTSSIDRDWVCSVYQQPLSTGVNPRTVFRSSSIPRRKKVAFTGIPIFIVSGLRVSTPSICATTRGPSANSTAPEQ